jgi:hypothetical protein
VADDGNQTVLACIFDDSVEPAGGVVSENDLGKQSAC